MDLRSRSLPLNVTAIILAFAAAVHNLYKETFGATSSWLHMVVPASLYTLQNWLNYFALSRLDATTHQVATQMRILTTALFAVTILRKQLTRIQWMSLIVLTGGLALTQIPDTVGEGLNTARHNERSDRAMAIFAVGVCCLTSAAAGVYLEKVLKRTSTPLLVRNVQLGILGAVLCAVFGVLLHDGAEIAEYGFFSGYGKTASLAVVLNAVGGLAVAAVIKVADNIVKNSAIALSIVASGVLSAMFDDFVLCRHFFYGGVLVIGSVCVYSAYDVSPGNLLPVFCEPSDEFCASKEKIGPTPKTDSRLEQLVLHD
ncbi:hypothetical protein HDU86_007764 [Geranomyces michiganensis]|nr:hypothetical protein HDU86_007764 [Geranomyces michiganensis]